MKKKLMSLALACTAAFVMTACGNSGGAAAAAAGGDAPAASAGAMETYDVGDFTVDVPSGWTAVGVSDMFADEEGAVKTDSILVAKGTPADEWGARTTANVSINYYQDGSYLAIDPADMYDDVSTIDGVTINGTACKASQYDSMGYVYQEIEYQTGDDIYVFDILTSIDGKDQGISWDNPEVMAIMESVKAK